MNQFILMQPRISDGKMNFSFQVVYATFKNRYSGILIFKSMQLSEFSHTFIDKNEMDNEVRSKSNHSLHTFPYPSCAPVHGRQEAMCHECHVTSHPIPCKVILTS